MTPEKVTIVTGSGRSFTGVPNVYLNEHKDTAEVYLDDILIVTYAYCNDYDEALEMMLEDYGVSEEEYVL